MSDTQLLANGLHDFWKGETDEKNNETTKTCDSDLNSPQQVQESQTLFRNEDARERRRKRQANAKAVDGTQWNKCLKPCSSTLKKYGIRFDSRNPGNFVKLKNWKIRRSSEEFIKDMKSMIQTMGDKDLEDCQLPLVNFLLKEVFETKEIEADLYTVQFWIDAMKKNDDIAWCYNRLFQYAETGLLKISDDATNTDVPNPYTYNTFSGDDDPGESGVTAKIKAIHNLDSF